MGGIHLRHGNKSGEIEQQSESRQCGNSPSRRRDGIPYGHNMQPELLQVDVIFKLCTRFIQFIMYGMHWGIFVLL